MDNILMMQLMKRQLSKIMDYILMMQLMKRQLKFVQGWPGCGQIFTDLYGRK